MFLKLQGLEREAAEKIEKAENTANLESIRIQYLGKKGELTALLRALKDLAPEERPLAGQKANAVRENIEHKIEKRLITLQKERMAKRLESEKIDITLPAAPKPLGSLHPLKLTENRMIDIFVNMGFDVMEGPEIESVHNNFDALNAPADHPSRDRTDTFYISENTVLRTQTSPVQIRAMRDKKPPLRIISPGRVYRFDPPDATHSPVFHQLEGLVVDKQITLGDLKGTLDLFAVSMFGEGTKTRLRPHNFPFTEPSVEVDFTCFACGGKGCGLCKGEGFIEMLGAGMVHPNVLEGCGIDSDIYSGFAFGMGIERIAMRKYNINDMRLLFENDLRFLSQF